MAYSPDLRRKVLEKLEQGCTVRQTAELFGIHFTTVQNWKKQPIPTYPKPPQVRRPKKIAKEALLADVQEHYWPMYKLIRQITCMSAPPVSVVRPPPSGRP